MSIPNIIVPVLNRYDLLDRAIASIDHPVDIVLVIDNGGALPTYLSNDNVGRIHVLSMVNNIGVPAAWNLGMQNLYRDPYWTIIGSDIEWEPGALARLEEKAFAGNVVLSNYEWNAFSIGSKVVQVVGGWDINYWPGYYEDTDMEIRIKAAAMESAIVRNSGVMVKADSLASTARFGGYHESKKKTDASNLAYLKSKIGTGMRAQEWSLKRWLDNVWEPTDNRDEIAIWNDEGVMTWFR